MNDLMKVFICYARVDQVICIKVVEQLTRYAYWYDHRLVPATRWWDECLSRLNWCNVFVYLMSKESLASNSCRKEYFIALETKRVILPILIDPTLNPDTDIPTELQEIHYVDMRNGLTAEATAGLLNGLHQIEMDMLSGRVLPTENELYTLIGGEENRKNVPTPGDDVTNQDPSQVMKLYSEYMDSNRYEDAVVLLQDAISKYGKEYWGYINMENLLEEARSALISEANRKEQEMWYRAIAELVKRKRTRYSGALSFIEFLKKFLNYDPQNLLKILMEDSETAPLFARNTAQNGRADTSQGGHIKQFSHINLPHPKLPLLEWVDIPTGTLSIDGHAFEQLRNHGLVRGEATLTQLKVGGFKISRYVITNEQFIHFLKDRNGYNNLTWWEYSSYAYNWRLANPMPLQSGFGGAQRPRETINWYDAVAFCNWLSDLLGVKITLPTVQQWQRAARGDSLTLYPWGDHFDPSLCNTTEGRVRMTTLVNHFKSGRSPFDVFNMSGNVLEWCLNARYEKPDLGSNARRAAMGGSFMSTRERAQVMYLSSLQPEVLHRTVGFRVVMANS